MQKSSTMGLRGSRIFEGGQLTIGMDLRDRSSCYCVLDEPGAAPRASKKRRVFLALTGRRGARILGLPTIQ